MTVFLENKYTRWYNNIINRGLDRELPTVYTEKHHIVPKCLGGSNFSINLVILTAKEHFICHLLLTKMVSRDNNRKVLFAFRQMSYQSGNQERYINSRLFESIKKNITHSDESKKKMSDAHMGLKQTKETIEKRVIHLRGKESPLKGREIQTDASKELIGTAVKNFINKLTPEEKKHRMLNSCCKPESYTPERSKKISQSQIGKKVSEETKRKMSTRCIFVSPNDTEFRYDGLKIGCDALSLNYGSVRNYISSSRLYKGWSIRHE